MSQHTYSARDPARILILPPHDLWALWTGRAPGDEEDRERPFRILAQHGIAYKRIDIHRWPLNPAARAHPALRAIDPLRALHVLLRERNADLVLCFFEPAALVLLLLRRLFRFRARVAVVDVGALDGWRIRRMIQNMVVPRADILLPYSAQQANLVRQIWPRARRVESVFANVDCDFYTMAADQPAGPVLAIGDDASRDYATFLSAIETLDHPVVLRTRLALPTAPAHPRLQLLTTMLATTAYRDLIASAAIVVLPLHPADYAGGVTVLVQAMASGKAVIVSASAGIAEYVEHEVSALVVPCHDAAALRTAMARLLQDHALRQRLGLAARARAQAIFSLQAWAARIGALVP